MYMIVVVPTVDNKVQIRSYLFSGSCLLMGTCIMSSCSEAPLRVHKHAFVPLCGTRQTNSRRVLSPCARLTVAIPMCNPSRQEGSIAYSHKLDSTEFWKRLIEHIFVLAFFAWLSAGFLARKEFRVDLTEAHLMEVFAFEDLFCLCINTDKMLASDLPRCVVAPPS